MRAWYFSGVNGEIIPNWDAETNNTGPLYDIPYDGYLMAFVHVDNAVEDYSKWIAAGLTLQVKGRAFLRANAACSHNHIMFDNSGIMPVKKGDTFNFYSTQNPNAFGCNSQVFLYGLL